MVSMKDIAKRAGVSIATVSYALNGSSKIPEATRKKIKDIANEMYYVPNAMARSLKKQETKIIGIFFILDYSGSFFGPILQGIYESLADTGYEVIVCYGENSHRFLPEQVIDGAIILDAGFSTEELTRYADHGHKMVVLDREINHPNINQILLDNRGGSKIAIDYLLEKGHRKLYIVKGHADAYDANERLLAVRETVQQYKNIEYYEIEGSFDKQSGELAAEKIVKEYSEPAAIFCLNDNMAIGMYDYISNTHYRIGEHFHIIGFDHTELSQYVTPKLATIDYSKRQWGTIAAKNLLKLLDNKQVSNEMIQVSLVEGESVKNVNNEILD
ncbi:LacI family DNA-binding transcriptional regulator [Bacillus sp. FJAT-49732]|uniref:LacI family DNA-binding transcriptional regulator n=1 Tax=Lederbergia citrisecunda TaxID=2833583 RepID=A0A942YN20_9BACI|nr:LacI family DNA-binding transcriptional regulator [Lederbergia citrisecunda]MBS4199881.1 LacI family DNA-binding transcriptional regulator [Lederbergia citrisecunda]